MITKTLGVGISNRIVNRELEKNVSTRRESSILVPFSPASNTVAVSVSNLFLRYLNNYGFRRVEFVSSRRCNSCRRRASVSSDVSSDVSGVVHITWIVIDELEIVELTRNGGNSSSSVRTKNSLEGCNRGRNEVINSLSDNSVVAEVNWIAELILGHIVTKVDPVPFTLILCGIEADDRSVNVSVQVGLDDIGRLVTSWVGLISHSEEIAAIIVYGVLGDTSNRLLHSWLNEIREDW